MNNKNKSKPGKLNPSIKRLIVHRAITQRYVPREFLANELIKEITEAGEIPPAFETAKRYISKARNTDNPIDKPWTLACCSEYASFFPPESIPILIDYMNFLGQIEFDNEVREIFGSSISKITIRDAIWMIRLKTIIEHLSPKLMIENEPLPFAYPVVIAMMYSGAEMASEILGEGHFDSSDLDNALFAGDIKILSTLVGKMIWATSKPCKWNGKCESCDYVKVPGIARMCIPKRKEGAK